MTKEPHVSAYMDENEQSLIEALDADDHRPKSILTHEMLDEHKAAARNLINEVETKVSIRIGQTDLARVKAKALREGVPYQTLIKSIIHQAVRS